MKAYAYYSILTALLSLVIGFGLGRRISPDWDACVASFGPHMDHENVSPDNDHGVKITLVGESGKMMSFTNYPNEARKMAKLLNDVAESADPKTVPVTP